MDHLHYVCFVFVMLSRLFIAALWSSAGKVLTSWLLFMMFNCVFVTFPCDILGQMRYSIVSIPDLCHLSYFVLTFRSKPNLFKGKCQVHAFVYLYMSNTCTFLGPVTQRSFKGHCLYAMQEMIGLSPWYNGKYFICPN